MGFLKNLFGGRSSDDGNNKLTKTAEMLDEHLYWRIIDQSLRNSQDKNKQEEFLKSHLNSLDPKNLIGFYLRTEKLLFEIYTSEMWCAAYIINGGCSDDGFDFFRNWVISKGKDIYYKAKQNPDSLVEVVDKDIDEYEFESLWYIPQDIFEAKMGKHLFKYVDTEFKFDSDNYSEIDFNWDEDDPETMKAICPKLFAKMWDQ